MRHFPRVFLVRDGQMSGKRVHILEKEQIAGGACDGYKYEGARIRHGAADAEMDNHFECMWDLFRLDTVNRNRGRERT